MTKTKREKMIIVLVFAITIAGAVGFACLMLTAFPSRITIEDNYLCLNKMLGKGQRIPLNEIAVIEMPENLLSHLIRVGGTSVGKIKYGHYKNTKTGQKMFLYLTGNPERTCFIYKDKIFVVDGQIPQTNN